MNQDNSSGLAEQPSKPGKLCNLSKANTALERQMGELRWDVGGDRRRSTKTLAGSASSLCTRLSSTSTPCTIETMRNLGVISKASLLIASSTLLNVAISTHASGSEVRAVNECSLSQSLLLSQASDQPPQENADDVSDALVAAFDEATRGKYSVSEFLSKADEDTLFAWIANETSAQKASYCYRRSYGRGVGTIPTEPGANREKIGALSYSVCPPNTRRVGFDCHSVCPDGMRDDGLFCRKSEYGRGAGFVTRSICNRNADRWGVSECERYGALFYPKCRSGYSAFGSNICRPNPPDCNALGLGGRFDLSCAKKVITGDAKPLVCESSKENDAGLCYPSCRGGFYGEGPVCWQSCNAGTVNCGAGCASSKTSCTTSTISQVTSSLTLFANIASFGLGSAAKAGTTATSTITESGQVVRVEPVLSRSQVAYNGVKSAVGFLITKFRSNPTSTAARVKTAAKEIYALGNAIDNFVDVAEADMADMTTSEIVNTLKSKFGERGYKQVAKRYALRFLAVSLGEFGLEVAKGLTALDPTGISGVLSAYTKPLCDRNTPFPDVKILSKD